MAEPACGYVAGKVDTYLYPGAGDKPPPGGADVHLLTVGGICVRGKWVNDGRFLGWAPLHKRNKEKEQALLRKGSK